MVMMYRCTKSSKAFRLTKGKTYAEWASNVTPFNAGVRNDDGRVIFVPRLAYFIVEG